MVLACITVALCLRVWLLGHAGLNSDEAVVGLNALQIRHGHFSAFVWSQTYGGVEPYVVALMFAVFGSSPFVLNATPVLLAVVAAAVVWRIGLRLFPPVAAITAATLTFVWPESSLWNSTKEYGYHEIGLVMGLLVLWEAVRIVQTAKNDGKDVVRDWVLLGLAMGIGWWATPETLYFTLPAAVVVALSLRAHRGVGIGTRVVAVASASWLVRSLGSWPACGWEWPPSERRLRVRSPTPADCRPSSRMCCPCSWVCALKVRVNGRCLRCWEDFSSCCSWRVSLRR